MSGWCCEYTDPLRSTRPRPHGEAVVPQDGVQYPDDPGPSYHQDDGSPGNREPAEQAVQLVRVGGLLEVADLAQQVLSLDGFADGGKNDDRDRGEPCVLPLEFPKLPPVHNGRHEVEEDQVGRRAGFQ